MSSLTLEQAAQASGLSAREIRLALEEGRLRGAVLAGRWHVEPSEVDGLVDLPDPGVTPVEPWLKAVPPTSSGRGATGGQAPAPGDRPDAGAGAASHGAAVDGAAVEELVSRLEQRAIEVARLRGELEALREGRDEHGARVERELGGLRRELGDTRGELARAHERIAELEDGRVAEAQESRMQQRARA
jgi:hypothetical protein